MIRRRNTENLNNPNRAAKAIKVAIFVFAIVFLLEMWMTNHLTTYGEKIQHIKNAKEALALENQVLENQIAQKSSLSGMERKVNVLGFDAIKKVEYLQTTVLAAAH